MRTGMEKLNCLLQIKNSLPSDSDNLTEGARNFVHQCLNPITNCFEKHFNKDKHKFIEKWGTFSHSTFKKNAVMALKIRAVECGLQSK